MGPQSARDRMSTMRIRMRIRHPITRPHRTRDGIPSPHPHLVNITWPPYVTMPTQVTGNLPILHARHREHLCFCQQWSFINFLWINGIFLPGLCTNQILWYYPYIVDRLSSWCLEFVTLPLFLDVVPPAKLYWFQEWTPVVGPSHFVLLVGLSGTGRLTLSYLAPPPSLWVCG